MVEMKTALIVYILGDSHYGTSRCLFVIQASPQVRVVCSLWIENVKKVASWLTKLMHKISEKIAAILWSFWNAELSDHIFYRR